VKFIHARSFRRGSKAALNVPVIICRAERNIIPAGISLVGFGTVIDSLYAIWQAVFEKKWVSLNQLQSMLAHNWQGDEGIQNRMIHLPKYGDGHSAVDDLAAKLTRDLAEELKSIRNERNGFYQPSLFVYYAFT
jgi:formate C-acetyltransferase